MISQIFQTADEKLIILQFFQRQMRNYDFAYFSMANEKL